MSINAIKSQMLGVQQAKTNVRTDVKEEEKKQTTQQLPTTNKQISADDVFKFMSAVNAPVQMKKTLNVKAFVNEESKSRIEDSMKNFEEQFKANLSAVKSEFGSISDELAEKITLSMF